MNAEEKARELGARDPADHGINWTWANGFPSEESAREFIKWLDENGYEHRGYYSQDHSVRYRKF